ncbi:MAG: cupin domain-containing protein, partial [Candidatus Omnitrophica bacterium]|nr:cupin domain-containing protein [Candidatus Omnitrophota bacterium]
MKDFLFINTKDMEWNEPFEGVKRTILQGNNLTICLYNLKAGLVFPAHSHENEQMAYIIKGKVEFSIGEEGEKHIFEEGMFFAFGPNVKHGAKFLEDSIVVDVFSPPMKDYEKEALKP